MECLISVAGQIAESGEEIIKSCQQNVSKNPENSKKHWNK